jgi:hypothetical protein
MWVSRDERSDVEREGADVEEDPRLPGTKGIRMLSLGNKPESTCADQVQMAKALETWVERHAVLKPTGSVRYGCGSNRCPASLPYTRWVKMDDGGYDQGEQ